MSIVGVEGRIKIITGRVGARAPARFLSIAEEDSVSDISDNQLSYISGVDFGHGLLKCGSTIVPFVDHFPKNGRLYQLMTTKMSERVEQAS